eukprot:TRINITY_DN8927_c0_g1_i3.p1 TRINITY_DN8927_c0_g1~~TRINITY_DN8927_c0_g1_i3.p1  ORF type:complete len:461 (+),score=9.87 TRINITY_DN8927_c0_g1_i3:123-1505(+)
MISKLCIQMSSLFLLQNSLKQVLTSILVYSLFSQGLISNEFQAFDQIDEVCIMHQHSNQQCYTDSIWESAGDVWEVVGGGDVIPCRFPYLISLQMPNYNDDMGESCLHFCGGTLISPRVVMTAAHCIATTLLTTELTYTVIDIRPETRFAALDPYCRHMQGKDRVNISQAYVHSGYKGDATTGNDIALLLLEREFKNFNGPYANYKAAQFVQDAGWSSHLYSVVGWGATNMTDTQNLVYTQSVKPQQMGYLTYINDRDCNQSISQYALVDSQTMVCFLSETTDSCKGDSGGPLIASNVTFLQSEFQKGSPWDDVQVGITSWGPDMTCGGGDVILPGVYTNVANYVTWIDEVLSVIKTLDIGNIQYAYTKYEDLYDDRIGYQEDVANVFQISLEIPKLDVVLELPDKCLEDVLPGYCNQQIERYYYDSVLKVCRNFTYTGCFGNRNNFETLSSCKETCAYK